MKCVDRHVAPRVSAGLAALSAVLAGALFAGPALAGKEPPAPTPFDIVSAAPDSEWRALDPENTLILELPAGEVAIELRPDFAPLHVAQIKTLVRRKFYDGLKFHRVIEGFVAQGGDPIGNGSGSSDLPNIPPEFVREASTVDRFAVIGRDRIAARVGFVDGLPVAAEPETLRSIRVDRRVRLWGAHCPGVMSMARATAPDSANSQFFLMFGDARLNLDQRYTVWGWIVDGFNNSRRINRGEPPDRPTPIVRMRIAADISPEERKRIEVLDTNGPTFARYLEAAGLVRNDFVRNLCGITIPRRINGDVKL